ncbi:hypothetical protein WN51_02535 [Melipona quadrifasciata]|uniref:Uncharacterized protein n=1 Tax=Melipona quadrifasciata TaxID=166423 RepID=A0A0M8ZVN6_9HYME|nr:hypothetical protein WN51_02535 [Melipona quadrifasciata]
MVRNNPANTHGEFDATECYLSELVGERGVYTPRSIERNALKRFENCRGIIKIDLTEDLTEMIPSKLDFEDREIQLHFALRTNICHGSVFANADFSSGLNFV